MARSRLFGVLVCLLAIASPAAAADKWKPIDRAALDAAAPIVQSAADAEALFWEVRVTDELSMIDGTPRTVLEHYVRIKIFTERGRDAQSTVELPHIGG